MNVDRKAPQVCISPQTRIMLEDIRTEQRKKGLRPTLGGIVDDLVRGEHDRIKNTETKAI